MITKTKAFSGIMLTLLLSSMLVLTFSIQPVESDWTWTETVYILTDGSVDPPDAPISTADNITYTLTSNIAGGIPESAIAIIVERDDIVFDGAGHTIEGINASDSIGVVLNGRRNVTIANMEITLFAYGILLCHSNYTRISENNITENGWGIRLYPNSHYNIMTANNITKQYGDGIRNGEQHTPSNHNIISDNNLSENGIGVYVAGSSNINITLNRVSASIDTGVRVDYSSSYVEISQNNMTYNGIPATPGSAIIIWNSTDCQVVKNWIASNNHGLIIEDTSQIEIIQNDVFENNQGVKWVDSSSDAVYHNNFVDNSHQVYVQLPGGSINSWDNGYPSGGNYWSDYAGIDLHSGPSQNEAGSDGMGDTPYVINENNTDRYPLANPWPSGWKLDFVGSTNHPIVDFAICNGSLYAAADNRLYAYDGSSWNVIAAPTFVTSLETMIGMSSMNSTYGGSGLEEANCLIQTSDGGYVLAGQNTTGSGRWDFRWVKTDANGVVQWSHSYGTGADDRAYSAVQTADGGYALAGDRKAGFGDGDFWLIRADANGNTLWNKTYGTPNYNGATSIVQTPDGGFALSGWTDSPMGNNNAWLVKTDENGSLQWDKILGGPYYDGSNSMILTADGGYALAGQSQSYSAGYDFWLVKTDSSGNMEWNKTYGGMNDDIASSIIATHDGGYALVGSTASFGAGPADSWLVKTDAEGNMEWNKTYGGMDVDQGYSLIQTTEGGYLLAGYTRSFGAGNGDAWLLKTDTSGNVEWNQTYGGTGDDCARSLIETHDGEYAFAGYTWSSGSGASDFWLVKTESKPYLFCGGQGGLHRYDGVGFTEIFEVSTYVKTLGIYDNTLYIGTMLDNPPKLYYCNGPPENPANWHIDTDFSDILDFSGPFGSIDSFAVYNGKIHVASGNTVYCFDGTSWSAALSYEYAYAFLDMQVYNGKLYLATRDQNRIPMHLGGTGFSGVIIEFDGENWTTVLGHDYWIYSLEEYDGKLYVGTANRIYTFNGTFWNVSFYSAEGAYYAISMINYDGKIYAGMGNGHIFTDPISETVDLPDQLPTTAVLEFPSTAYLILFMISSLPTIVLVKKRLHRKPCTTEIENLTIVLT